MTKRPSWVTPWGVVAILIGAYGVFAGAAATMTPRLMKMQREMIREMGAAATESEGEAAASDAEAAASEAEARRQMAQVAEEMAQVAKGMERMFGLTPAQERWLVVSGALGAVLSGLYILAAAFVLQLRPIGAKLFVGAAAAKIALALVALLVTPAGGFGAFMMLPGALTGIVAHAVMLAILLVNVRDLAPGPEPAGFEAPR